MAIVCPACGNPVKFITAGNIGVYMVNTEIETLIGEKGRILTGYRIHKCPAVAPKNAGENTSDISQRESNGK